MGTTSASPRLPRTRGDGPLTGETPFVFNMASPHPRGWTLKRERPLGTSRGFPAPAGMDPSRVTRRSPSPGLPRTRGDGPGGLDTTGGQLRASPHPRGWTLGRVQVELAAVGFPAPAGMDPKWPRCWPARRRLPRTRGDGPKGLAEVSTLIPASPHPRGWTREPCREDLFQLGFPAPAGMDPLTRASATLPRWLPRTRGDGPVQVSWGKASAAASPHPRGWTRGVGQHAVRPRGFPAPAGMDP